MVLVSICISMLSDGYTHRKIEWNVCHAELLKGVCPPLSKNNDTR